MAFVSNPVTYGNGLEAEHFVNFNPSLEYGFRTGNLIKRERTNVFQNINYLSLEDASSLFHNFYGLRVSGSISQRETSGSAKFPSTMNYQTMSNPRSRYSGGQVNQVQFGTIRDNDAYVGGTANLYSTTNQMNMFYSQPNGEGNFLGFGQFLFSGDLRGRTSRYGGEITHYIAIASWEVPKNFIPGSAVSVSNPDYGEKEGASPYKYVSYFDGEYQRHLNSLYWQDRRLIPNVDGTYNTTQITFNDYNGNRIQLKKTEAVITKVSKYPIYKYREDGSRYLEKVEDIKPPRTTFNIGEGLFYKYSGSTSKLQPNNYGL